METLFLLLYGIVISVCVSVQSLSVSLSVLCLYCNQLLDSLSAYMFAGLIACCLFALLVLSICTIGCSILVSAFLLFVSCHTSNDCVEQDGLTIEYFVLKNFQQSQQHSRDLDVCS